VTVAKGGGRKAEGERRSLRRSPSALRVARPHLPAIVVFGAVALAPTFVNDNYLLDTLVLVLLWGALAGAWNVAGGYAGQVSLGHAAFFGIGTYSAALAAIHWQVSAWVAMFAGGLVSTAAGLLIGYLSNRLRGPYFALATIAFAQVLLIVFSRWREFTRGGEGISVPFRPGVENLAFVGKQPWVYVALLFALLVYAISVYLESSRLGYQLAGVREDENAAEALGIHSRRLKVVAIALSAFLTSILGTFWAQYIGFVDPFYVFSIDLSVRFALMAIIGGLATALGPFFGSLLITSLESYLRATISGGQAAQTGIYLIIYGVLLIVVVRFLPQGLMLELGRRLQPRRARAEPAEADRAEAERIAAGTR
jgi:branched-chain amino acid transport system permease protein